jgi:pectinesterase
MRKMRLVLILALLGFAIVAGAQAPTPVSREISDNVSVNADLVYASYGDRELLLDLYRPQDAGSLPLPTILVIRGGGRGDKEGFGFLAAALAQRGLAAVSLEFRASAEAIYPAAVQDTKAAVRWVRANADEYGLDADSIGVIGGSWGAYLATYLGFTANVPELEGEGGNSSQSSAVSAVVGLATIGDFTTAAQSEGAIANVTAFLGASYEEAPSLWESASPISHIGPSAPPTLLIHSAADSVVPFGESIELSRSLGSAGVAVELVLVPDAPHAFWSFEQWFGEAMDRAASFFRMHL